LASSSSSSSSCDIHSHRVRTALLKRELPFTQVNLDACPSHVRNELLFELLRDKTASPASVSISGAALPRLVVNGSPVRGVGVKPVLRLLRSWDKDERYACALERYETEVERRDSEATADPALADKLERICDAYGTSVSGGGCNDDDGSNDDEDEDGDGNPANNSGSDDDAASQLSYAALRGDELMPPSTIPLPTSSEGVEQTASLTTYHDMTEALRSILTLTDTVHKGTMYRNCFVGSALVEAIRVSMRLSNERAVEYCDVLVRHRVIVRVSGQPANVAMHKPFKPCGKGVYRLQSDTSPDILNSYRMHNGVGAAGAEEDRESSASSSASQRHHNLVVSMLSPAKVVHRLDAVLSRLEVDSLNSRGKVDYAALVLHPNYPVFEEAVCSLQLVDVSRLPDDDHDGHRIALGINLYKLMMRYAQCKVGFVANDEDREHFRKTVKFIVGGTAYTFSEWLHETTTTTSTSRTSVVSASSSILRSSDGSVDRRRRKQSVGTVDWRVQLAVYCDPMFGSRFSLPFRRFSAQELDEELDLVARTVLQDRSVLCVDPADRNVLKLSRVFQWHSAEFGSTVPDVMARISEYIPDAERLARATAITYVDVPSTSNAISYARYTKDSVVGHVTAVGYMLMGRFKPPPTPCNELLRVATLRSLNLLDTATTDERINRITNQCQSELKAPVVCVTLVDSTRQWFKSSAWECSVPPVPETPKDISFCGHAVAGAPSEALVVEDATADDRFADNPFVAGDFGARFYAGIPLSFPSGGGVLVNIGTLCVIDFKPRQLSDSDMDKLRHYSNLVKQEILRLDDGSTDLCSRCSDSSLDSDDDDDDDEGEEFEYDHRAFEIATGEVARD
jgi:GAF domain-containing protein